MKTWGILASMLTEKKILFKERIDHYSLKKYLNIYKDKLA